MSSKTLKPIARPETEKEREYRINAYALKGKIDPLLGKFYTSLDLVTDSLEDHLTRVKISFLNKAYNKLRSGEELDDKEKALVTGVVKALFVFVLRPMRDYLGQAQFDAFLLFLSQKFVDSYASSFKVPEEMMETDGEEDAEDSEDGESDGDDADSDGDEEDGEGGDSDEEDADGDEEDEDAEDDEEMTSESATIRHINATAMIVVDCVRFCKMLDWEQICIRLAKMKDTTGFSSESATVVSKRITFRKAEKLKHLSDKSEVYLYEIVLNGEPIGLIHSMQHTDNTPSRRAWRVSIRNHFQDAKYRSGFDQHEPFTVVRGNNVTLHNPNPMTMDEAKAWARVAIEVQYGKMFGTYSIA